MSSSKRGYCHSYTAPVVSDEARKEEFNSLDNEVRDQYENEVNGTAAILRETPEMVEAALRDFHHALKNLEAEDYRRATEVAPQVVAHETPPLLFLRAEQFDGKAAAARLAAYWKSRVSLFGEKAFAPLTFEESLDDDDRAFWNMDVIIPLPRDKYGRSVVYMDRGKWLREYLLSGLRCFSMVFHQLVRTSVSQKQGCVLVIDVRHLALENFDRKASRRIVTMIRECVPIRVAAVHVCCSSIVSPAKLILPAIMWMFGKYLRLHTRFHFGSPTGLAWDLDQTGITQDCLPKCVGGNLESTAPMSFWKSTHESLLS